MPVSPQTDETSSIWHQKWQSAAWHRTADETADRALGTEAASEMMDVFELPLGEAAGQEEQGAVQSLGTEQRHAIENS